MQHLKAENEELRAELKSLKRRAPGVPAAPASHNKTMVIEPLRPSLSAESRRIWDNLSFSRAAASFTQSPLMEEVGMPRLSLLLLRVHIDLCVRRSTGR